MFLQIEKVPEASDSDITCYVFSLDDAVTHLAVSDPSGILRLKSNFIALWSREIFAFHSLIHFLQAA